MLFHTNLIDFDHYSGDLHMSEIDLKDSAFVYIAILMYFLTHSTESLQSLNPSDIRSCDPDAFSHEFDRL
jgi:hypothetical protein